jgi:hypothetical protein
MRFELCKRHSVAVVPDVARECPFSLNTAQGEDATLWLLTKQVSNELEISRNRPDVVLCDRGVPDILAHLEEAKTRGVISIRLDSLKPFLFEWCKSYDLVFVSRIDIEIPTAADSLRVPDDSFRAQMEAFSDAVLAQFTPRARTVALSAEERLAESLALIERELKRKSTQ